MSKCPCIMKRLTITFILNIIIVQSHDKFTNSDVTTLLPLTESNTTNNIKKYSPFKRYNVSDSVYLEDVVFALKNQDWTKEDEICLNRTLIWLKNLQNFTLWAVWNWDSLPSEPQGVLYGNRYHLGNFDECLYSPWYNDHPELRTQYCLADIVIQGTDIPVKKKISNYYDPYQSALNLFKYKSFFRRTLDMLTWGICVPDVCQPKSVEKLMKVMLAHSHLGEAGMRSNISVNDECQKTSKTRPFDAQFYAFVWISNFFSEYDKQVHEEGNRLSTITLLHHEELMYFYETSVFLLLYIPVLYSRTIFVFVVALCLICTKLNHRRRYLDQNTLGERIVGSFDLVLNAKTLLDKKEEDLNILYGIKFITIMVIVIGHQHGFNNGGAVSNGLQVDEDAEGLLGMLFLHDDIAVDTFFCISGFLLATSMIKLKKITNPLNIVFIRYMRLIVAYAIVVFYTSAIYPYTGSGPLWNRAIEADTVQCRRNWWLNMLMVSNYVDSENICLVISWYIPCDFHFFIFTLLLLWIYRQFPWPGKILFVFVMIAAIITPGVINYVNELPPIHLFTYDFLTNPRGTKQFHLTYIKSHTRYAANLVGFFGGWIYVYCSSSERFKHIPQKWATTGAFIALSTIGVMLFTGPLLLMRKFTVLESAVYAALNRPLYSCGVVMFIICCARGNVPILKGFLSWYPFAPLSRLTYGLYLTHTLFISWNIYITRNPQYSNLLSCITSSLGIVCQSLFVALLMWLFAEAPVKNLIKICTMRPQKNRNEKGEENTGYLPDNLPSNAGIEVISSKI